MAVYREQLTFLKRLSSRPDSVVYLCQEKKSKDLVVLKQTRLLSPSLGYRRGDNPWQEYSVAQLLFSLGGHPHLLKYRSAHTESDSVFLLMDFCEQGDLYSFLESQAERRLHEPLARHIFHQIALGVQFLHQHGVAHRDLSLENVLLDDKHIPKLCDFGLSAFFSTDTSAGNKARTAVGRVGKGYYMAPEVIADKDEYDPVRADIWSLGILFFILLTGSPLFETATPQDQAFAAIQKVGIRGILRHWKLEHEISAATIDLLTKMIQFEPENRFSSVDEILAVMDA